MCGGLESFGPNLNALLSSSKGTAKLLSDWSLSRAAFRKSNLFRKRMSLVVVYPPPWFESDFASRKEPEAVNGSDILAFCRLILPSLTCGRML